ESFDIECWDPRTESIVYLKSVGNQNVGRIGEGHLEPGLHYDYRIKSDISEFSDYFTRDTTPVIWGKGANTIIKGDSITYYIPPTDSIPAVPPFVHNNLWIDTYEDITQDMYLHVLWHPEEWVCSCGREYNEKGTLAYYLRGEDIAIASMDSIIVYYPTDPEVDLDFEWVTVHSCRNNRFDYSVSYELFSDHAIIGIRPNQFNPELDTLVVIVLGPYGLKPVTLSSFTASYLAESSNVKLTWIVESETEMLGYNVFRNYVDNLSSALLISPLIDATNSSSTHSYIFNDNELAEIDSCYYWLQSIEYDGREEFYGPVLVRITHRTNQEVPSAEIPTGFTSLFPNPFNPSITIGYNLQVEEPCHIDVYNIKGQKVITLVDEFQKAGLKRVVWNGLDSLNRPCSSGIYIVNMKTNRCHDIRKVIMIK
ncbi:MAG: T9SS type A sorting domain-containing protein, partial [Candidatus Cloacimonetes bacterium]|nr:T9SS type A sorting domain-containing protein [Candidatus Cloacimonadota bacterium]